MLGPWSWAYPWYHALNVICSTSLSDYFIDFMILSVILILYLVCKGNQRYKWTSCKAFERRKSHWMCISLGCALGLGIDPLCKAIMNSTNHLYLCRWDKLCGESDKKSYHKNDSRVFMTVIRISLVWGSSAKQLDKAIYTTTSAKFQKSDSRAHIRMNLV